MEQFTYTIRPTRMEMLSAGPTDQEGKIIGAHASYLQDLMEQGTVMMAGRTLTTDDGAFGIVILEAESLAAAQFLMDNDPAVKKGIMEAVLSPFRIAMWSERGPRKS